MTSENNDADSSAEQPAESPIIPFLQLRGSNKPVKTSWPELKGSTAQEAERTIKEQMPGVCIYMIKPGDFVTFDYRLDRVRLIVDSSGKVVETPALG